MTGFEQTEHCRPSPARVAPAGYKQQPRPKPQARSRETLQRCASGVRRRVAPSLRRLPPENQHFPNLMHPKCTLSLVSGNCQRDKDSIKPADLQEFPENGARGTRTPDLLGAIQALSQLSYSPVRTACAARLLDSLAPAPYPASGLSPVHRGWPPAWDSGSGQSPHEDSRITSIGSKRSGLGPARNIRYAPG